MTIEKSKQGLIITFVILISGIISSYASYIHFEPTQLLGISPMIGMIIGQLFLFRMFEIPENRGLKDDLFITVLTILSWFISLTILLQL